MLVTRIRQHEELLEFINQDDIRTVRYIDELGTVTHCPPRIEVIFRNGDRTVYQGPEAASICSYLGLMAVNLNIERRRT